MGFLEKYAAYRWATGGGGDGGDNPLVLIMVALVCFFFVMLAIEAAVTFIHETVHGISLYAPHLVALVLGALFATLVVLVGPYSPEQAASALSTEDSVSVYAKIGAVLLLLNGLFVAAYHEIIPLDGPVSLVLGIVFIYYLYLVYKTNRLVGAAPNGDGIGYQYAVLLPFTTGVAIELFDIPTASPSIWLVGPYLVAINAPLLVGYYLLKNRVEPDLGTAPDRRATDADGPAATPTSPE